MRTAAALVALVLASPAAAQAPSDVRVASHRDGGSLVVDWRFSGRSPAPLESVSLEVGGARQPDGTVRAYPWQGAQTLALVLFEAADPSRGMGFRKDQGRVFQIADKAGAHHAVGIGSFSHGAVTVFGAGDDRPETIANMVAGASGEGPSPLETVVADAIAVMARARADRKVLILVSDAFSSAPVDGAALGARAAAAGIALTFVAREGRPGAAHAALRDAAAASGGDFVDDAAFDAWLPRPFASVDNGAQARFAVDPAPVAPWSSPEPAKVVFARAGSSFSVPVDLQAPVMGAAGIAGMAARSPLAWGALGLLGLAAAGVLAALRRRRPAERTAGVGATLDPEAADARLDPAAPSPVPHWDPGEPVGVFQAPDGSELPFYGETAKVGRASTNEVVLDDDTVSRIHATVARLADGSFEISGESTVNPLRVNGEVVGRAALAEGDVVTLGGVSLRFAPFRSAGG